MEKTRLLQAVIVFKLREDDSFPIVDVVNTVVICVMKVPLREIMKIEEHEVVEDFIVTLCED